MLTSSMLISSLTTRQFRVYKLFSNKSMAVVSFFQLKYVVYVFLMAIPEIILLVIWTAVDPLQANVDSSNHIECTSEYDVVFYVLLLTYKGLLLSSSSILAFLSRNYPSAFSDAKLIAFAIYNATLISMIMIPIILVISSIPFAQWLFIELLIIVFFFWVHFQL